MGNKVRPLPKTITKRDGSIAPFDLSRVDRAVTMCYASFEDNEVPQTPVADIVVAVGNAISHRFSNGSVPTVEQVQDIVEMALVQSGEFEAARHYILYREEHAKQRVVVPIEVQAAFDLDAQYFPTQVQQFMYYDKYARFNWDLRRRETWHETVDRVVNYLIKLSGGALDLSVYERIRESILQMQAMPSMRALAMAGPAAERNSMAIYNCSYLPIDCADALAEIMLISLAGCGVGISVERDHVEQFPRVKRQTGNRLDTHLIDDSAEGWGEAVRLGCNTWINGDDIEFDFSAIELNHPAGTPLKTKGGRASGPEPLRFVLKFCREKILSRQGRFLSTVDIHDMGCVIGGAAVSGGVRRTAMISLFDYDDLDMRTCKDGAKLDQNPWRWNANNSAVWPEEIEQLDLIKQFVSMDEGKRGEPGIFSRTNANRTKPQRRAEAEFGSNPCGEITLRPMQFCNLTIAVARKGDSLEDLIDKVEVATIIGTIQSLATTFPNMRPQWKQNCEDERLLGVDINGMRDCEIFNGLEAKRALTTLRATARTTNDKYARALNINPSAAITCDKPNGNSSQLLDCSSGINTRWSQFYVRNMRCNTYTPIYKVLKACGVPMSPENGQTAETADTWVVHFPMRAPKGAIVRHDVSAVDQCNFWLMCKTLWTDHNPSTTVTYEPEELIPVMQWAWEHRSVIGGMAFLPKDNAQYAQMPYEEIDEATYLNLRSSFPEIDWSLLYAFEKTDMSEAAQTLACLSGVCEVQ